MVDAGEDPAHAAQREFLEEAMDSENLEQNELEDIMKLVKEMFDQGLLVKKNLTNKLKSVFNIII
jgi:ADP-ribose pyrophosphatase